MHAYCISAATASTRLDDVFHHVTPAAMKLSSGRFKGEYRVQTTSTHAKVDGHVSGKSASGHYSISYTMMYGTTSTGLINLWACQEKGTWKATRR